VNTTRRRSADALRRRTYVLAGIRSFFTERAVVAVMATAYPPAGPRASATLLAGTRALGVPVTAASAAGTHLETGCRIRPPFTRPTGYPPLRGAKPAPGHARTLGREAGARGWGRALAGPVARPATRPGADLRTPPCTAGPASLPATPAH